MSSFINTKKALLLVNPTSGKLKAKSNLFDMVSVLNREKIQTTVQITQGKGHSAHAAKDAYHNGFDLVICCGGDGTLNETITGMMEAKVKLPLGYIPAGSTNDFANSMGISVNPIEATEQIAKLSPVPVDIGQFNSNRYFSYIASFGIFTAVSYSTPQATKNILGHLAYILEGVKDLTNIQSHHVVVETKTQRYEGDYIFGAVCNTTSVAGIVKIASDLVATNDGLFEVLLIKMPKNPAELHKIVMGLSFSDFSDEIFEFFKTEEVQFFTNPDLNWTLDGEFASVEDGAPVIKNLHQAISIYI
ncbi:MAG: diacylglycerol kinase family lipid kinase [Ruminococcaceae bacterium]|nr:diacylglycerol kinase family lipid kinase [Oscillospiraceae bacterium]